YRKNPQNEYKYNYKQTVNEILKKISHRGRTNKKILEIKNKKYNTFLGLISKCDISNKKITDKKIKKFNICLDGKIYNIDRLYKKYNSKTLQSLKTAAKSDDEKFKNLITCFGPEVIGEFKGAFALIYNDKENNIFIARDFLGRKPLYYSYNKKADYLLFASEVKALTNYSNNINEVPPGSLLKNTSKPKIIKDINIKNYSLSNFDEKQNECINENDIAEKIDTLLHLSIERGINSGKVLESITNCKKELNC
ncbi:MAG: hypothetical protein FJW61_00645, partial [Actinobacteria bacterium]|nr:hypothetical protein [Actinomycetota bacterium]